MYIIIPPNIELRTSFKILFTGQINIFPNINKKTIQAKKVITEFESKFNHLKISYLKLYLLICMIKFGQI